MTQTNYSNQFATEASPFILLTLFHVTASNQALFRQAELYRRHVYRVPINVSVIASVEVTSSLCSFVSSITQKLLNRFAQDSMEM